MMLAEQTAPLPEALPVAAFRDHLRLGSGFGPETAAETTALAGYLRAAIATIEARTGKVLLERSFRLRLENWREADAQVLPLAPVASIARVEITAADGAVQELAPARYRLVPDVQRPRLVSTTGRLPAVTEGGHVEIVFTAGFGADWGQIPPDLAQAVMLLAARYYEDRSFEGSAQALPFAIASLIERWRSVRLLGGSGQRRRA